MAGKEGKLALGRCTAATCEEASTKRGTLNGSTAQHKSAADGEDALLKVKAEEETDKILDVAATSEVTEPLLVDLAKAEAEGEIKDAVPVSEPQAEDLDAYEDEHEDDYGDDAEYDDEAWDDYEYEEEEYYYDEEEYGYEEEDYDYVREVLLSFPEVDKLEPHELDKAVDRLLEQSKPEYDNVAATGKIRLLKEDIKVALDQWKPPPPSILHNWHPNYTPSAESILRHEELEKEFLQLPDDSEEEQERERFRAKVRKDLIEKGYVEVDEDYYEKKDEYERQCVQKIKEEWNRTVHWRSRSAIRAATRAAKNE